MKLSKPLSREARRRVLAAAVFAFCVPSSAALAEDVLVTVSAGAAAMANGVFNIAIRDNVVNDTASVRSTSLVNSVLGTQGITQINQDSGIGSSQTNLVTMAIANGGTNFVTSTSLNGEIIIAGNTIVTNGVTRTNLIDNVLAGSSGIAQINQNSGNLNVNLNALAIGIGIGTGTAAVTLSDSALSKTASNNTVTANGPVSQSNVITNLGNFSGIAQISQVNGDANIAANALTVNINVLTVQ